MKKNERNSISQIRPYPVTTMFGTVQIAASTYPNDIAFDFMGKLTTYSQMIRKIKLVAWRTIMGKDWF